MERRKFINFGVIGSLASASLLKETYGQGLPENAGNPVIHFEIGCTDLHKTTEFYSSLFGWKPTDAGIASYLNTNSNEGIQGHITALGHEPYKYITFYIQVDNIEDYLINIQKAGGQKVVGPIKIPSGQQFALFKDLDGNVVGLLTKP